MPPTKSRLDLARPAVRPAMWGRVMLAGPSGSGKTWTSLMLAETLVEPTGAILVIDTEKESALTYADEFTFKHLAWAAPYDPRELTDTLRAAGELYDCVIVDSFTHFWRGTGGILDIANGKFTGWADARPAQVDVVEAILNCDAHVIVNVRQKQAHAQVENGKGGYRVEKLGMEAIQDDQLEYEVNVSVEIDMQHTLSISKSRTNAVPVGRTFHAGHAADFAVLYRDWLAAGEPVVEHARMLALIDVMNRIDDRGERTKAKGMFVERFGRPEFLLESRYDEAAGWVADVVMAANGGPSTGAATEGADEPHVDTERDLVDPEPEAAAQPPQEPVGDEPGPDAPPEPVEALSDAQGPAGEADATLADGSIDPEQLATIEQAVKARPLSGVREALEKAELSTVGSPQVLRRRLVEHLVERSLAARS